MILKRNGGKALAIALVIAGGFSACSKKPQEQQEANSPTHAAKVEIVSSPVPMASNLPPAIETNAPISLTPENVSTNEPAIPPENRAQQEQWFRQAVAALETHPLPDLAAAAGFLKQGAETGHAPSQQALGVLYLNGDGVQKDTNEALRWLQLSADQNFPEAQFKMASLYARGMGVETNLAKAAEYALKAADQGHIEAQYNVATMLMIGKGLPENLPEAAKWLRKASEGGHPTAQSNLGVLYANGRGVETNMTEAIKWFTAASEQGQPTAQFNLAQALQDGKGTAADPIEAYKWYSLAAEIGDRDASDAMLELSLKIKAEVVAEALKRARSFKAKRRLTPSGF